MFPQPDEKLVAACAVALGAMNEAGLSSFGTFPRTAEEMRRKAVVYAEALMPDPRLPSDPSIDSDCVALAVLKIRREPNGEDGKPLNFPSSGEFRRRCVEAWHELYRFVGRDVFAPDGTPVVAFVQVRRDAPPAIVERAVLDVVDDAKARGLVESVPALPEYTGIELRTPSFKPVPRASTETEADHEERRKRNARQIEELRRAKP